MDDKKYTKKKAKRREVKLSDILMDEEGVFDEEDEDRVTDDTLEFLSLDDEMIANYEKEKKAEKAPKKLKKPKRKAVKHTYEDDLDEDYDYDLDEDYYYEEEEYEDDGFDGDYEDEEYEDEDYEDDDYEDEEYEDGDYEDEEYEDDGFEDENYEDDEDSEGGSSGGFLHFIRNMSTLDVIVAMLGIVVFAGACLAGGLYANAKSMDRQVASFAALGEQMDGISVVGEGGLVAVSESARLSGMFKLEEEQQEENPEQKQEQNKMIEVSLKVTSIQSDIKIKFINQATGKLIGGVPFEVSVSGGNKKYDLKDQDKDGIIYETGVANGTYSVTVKPLGGDDAAKYIVPFSAVSVTVTDQIAYKKVDVADEVKTESEVNAAAEDTAAQDTAVESALTDTVEWVESTKTPIESDDNYQEVNRSDVADPAATAKNIGVAAFMKLVNDNGGSAPSTEETPEEKEPTASDYTVGAITGSTTIKVGETGSFGAVTTPEGGKIKWSSSDSSVAAVDESGKVTGIAKGTAVITASCGESSSTCTVTVEEETPEKTKITIAGDNALQVGESKTLKATVEPAGQTVTWSSSDEKILKIEKNSGVMTGVAEGSVTVTAECNGEKATYTVTVTNVKYKSVTISGKDTVQVGKSETLTATTDPVGGVVAWSSDNEKIVKIDKDKGVMTGIGAGTATITAVCGDAKATLKVTVKNDLSGDTTSKLKDKNGNQLFVKKDGKYVEAVYADYYTDAKLYLQKASSYRYTGWQTIDGNVYFFDKNGNYVTGEQVIQGAKYTFGSDGKLASSSGTMGIDVSKWNGSIDWGAVKNSGVSYVIIRCGYRGSSTGALIEDPKFRSNIQGAKAAGLKVGVYFFSQAVNEVEAVEEASMALSLASGYGLNYPIFLDVESSGGRGDKVDVNTRTAVCKAFCNTVQNSGYAAGIYANKTWLNEKINATSLTSYRIWLAQYASAPSYTRTKYDMWQYTSKGKVSGISGNVDLNMSYMNY